MQHPKRRRCDRRTIGQIRMSGNAANIGIRSPNGAVTILKLRARLSAASHPIPRISCAGGFHERLRKAIAPKPPSALSICVSICTELLPQAADPKTTRCHSAPSISRGSKSKVEVFKPRLPQPVNVQWERTNKCGPVETCHRVRAPDAKRTASHRLVERTHSTTPATHSRSDSAAIPLNSHSRRRFIGAAFYRLPAKRSPPPKAVGGQKILFPPASSRRPPQFPPAPTCRRNRRASDSVPSARRHHFDRRLRRPARTRHRPPQFPRIAPRA
jgi:hypothetical protein